MAIIPGVELGNIELFIIIGVFIGFIYLISKAMKAVFHIVWISGISALFPILANRFLGYTFPLNMNTFLSFIVIGVGIFLGYKVVKIVYIGLAIVEKTGKAVIAPLKKNKVHDLEKRMKEYEKDEDED